MLGLTNSLTNAKPLLYDSVGSVAFDGVREFINTGQTFQTILRDSFTIAFWVRTDTRGLNYFGTKESGDTDHLILTDVSGVLTFEFKANSDPIKIESDGAFFATDGTGEEWWHIAIVVTKTGTGVSDYSTVTIYKNGISLEDPGTTGALAGSNQGSYTCNDNLAIAALNNNNTFGSISSILGLSDFAVWNGALPEVAIIDLVMANVPSATGGRAKNLLEAHGNYTATHASTLQTWYKLDEGTGTTIGDSGAGAGATDASFTGSSGNWRGEKPVN
jgi:hypothetical protein